MPNFIDLTGQKFGRLVVLKRDGLTKKGSITWRCRCKCGKFVVIDGDSLRGKKTKSCGCLQRELARKKMSITMKGRCDHLNPRWRGDDAGKRSMHIWLRKNKPKPAFCERCKIRPPRDLSYNHTNGEWSRNPDDYEWLCRSCHKVKDMGWNPLTTTCIYKIRELYSMGVYTHTELANLFNISRYRVWNILNRKNAYQNI